jgi:hypothetical protein
MIKINFFFFLKRDLKKKLNTSQNLKHYLQVLFGSSVCKLFKVENKKLFS